MNTPEKLKELINKKYDVKLLANSRKDPISDLRICFFNTLMGTGLYNARQVVKFMGKDRSTAYHYASSIERIRFDKDLKKMYSDIRGLYLSII